jgi:hypothetical protein
VWLLTAHGSAKRCHPPRRVCVRTVINRRAYVPSAASATDPAARTPKCYFILFCIHRAHTTLECARSLGVVAYEIVPEACQVGVQPAARQPCRLASEELGAARGGVCRVEAGGPYAHRPCASHRGRLGRRRRAYSLGRGAGGGGVAEHGGTVAAGRHEEAAAGRAAPPLGAHVPTRLHGL